MGLPATPSERDIVEAIESAIEVLVAVENDEESWFDRLMACAARGFEHSNGVLTNTKDYVLHDEYRHAMFVMMQELVRARPIVLAARAETRVNSNCSTALHAAVNDYENA